MRYIIKVVAHLSGVEGAGTVLLNVSYKHRKVAEAKLFQLIGIDTVEDRLQCTKAWQYTDEKIDDRGRKTLREITLEDEYIRKEFTLIEW